MNYSLLIENQSNDPVVGYIPALRMSVTGESIVNVIKNAHDLLLLEALNVANGKVEHACFEEVSGYIVLFEADAAENNVSGYVPTLQISVIGDNLDDARDNAKDLIELEIQKSLLRGVDMPAERAVIEQVTIDQVVA